MMNTESQAGVRLDRWLWAARFFKTRGLAAQAIAGGKIQLNGRRPKRARAVHIGDTLRIRVGAYEHLVAVRDLSERRGPASEAQHLYEETAASRRTRELVAAQLKVAATTTFRGKGRPTKKERRDIEQLKREREQ